MKITKEKLEYLLKTNKEFNALELAVLKDVIKKAEEDKNYSFLTEVVKYGLLSGIVSELIYNEDLVKFYHKHKKIINKYLSQYFESATSLNLWDDTDPLALEENNQCILARFGYEVAAYDIVETLNAI